MTLSGNFVSILIQPEGGCNWRRPSCAARLARSFNPHPARRPDATSGNCPACLMRTCFNPHPARRPDATSGNCPACLMRTCFNPHPARRPDATASATSARFPRSRRFNPHPARRPDATSRTAATMPWITCFNPHPARRPDATLQQLRHRHNEDLFQSSSSPKAGCNQAEVARRLSPTSFNPHPARRPDATYPGKLLATDYDCFNPHPARRPDATYGCNDYYEYH